MEIIRLTKEFRFEMAHALRGHDGKCAGIHGHSYTLSVTVKGRARKDPSDPKDGMVMDFGDLSEMVKREIVGPLDHALLLREDDPHIPSIAASGSAKLVPVPYQPTCENMLLDFAGRLKARLPEEVELCALILQETATSYAEWIAEDNR